MNTVPSMSSYLLEFIDGFCILGNKFYILNYKFLLKNYEDGTCTPAIEFFEKKFKSLEAIASGHLTTSLGVKRELRIIDDVIYGFKEKHSFAADDWCIVNVEKDFTVIVNGFDEFEPVKVNTLQFYHFFQKWFSFLDSKNLKEDTIATTNTSEAILAEDHSFYSSDWVKTRKSIFQSSLKYFQPILKKYEMELVHDEDHEYGAVKLHHDKCEVAIAFERYCESLEIHIIDPQKKQSHHYGQLCRARKVQRKVISVSEINSPERSELELTIESIAFILDEYFSDLLQGDFSKLNSHSS